MCFVYIFSYRFGKSEKAYKDEAARNRLFLFVETLMLRRTKTRFSEGKIFKLAIKTVHTVHVELFEVEENCIYSYLCIRHTSVIVIVIRR